MISFHEEFSPKMLASVDEHSRSEFRQAHGVVRRCITSREDFSAKNVQDRIDACFHEIRAALSPETVMKYRNEVDLFMRCAEKDLRQMQTEIERTKRAAGPIVEGGSAMEEGEGVSMGREPERSQRQRSSPDSDSLLLLSAKEEFSPAPDADSSLLLSAKEEFPPTSDFDSSLLLTAEEEFHSPSDTDMSLSIEKEEKEPSRPMRKRKRSASEETSLFNALPADGVGVQVGNKFILAQPVAAEGGVLRVLVQESQGENGFKAIGSVVIDSKTGAYLSATDSDQQPLSSLSPILAESMDGLTRRLSTMLVIKERLVAEGVNQGIAKQIAEKWAQGWAGCTVDNEDSPLEPPTQYRGADRIVGLKIGGPLAARYGDYSITTLGSGVQKRAKKMARITADGQVEIVVRYTKLGPQEIEKFTKDMKKEMQIRQKLLERGALLTGELSNEHLYDHILWIGDYVSHKGRGGEVKIRYVGGYGSCTLGACLYGEKGVLLPEKERKKRQKLALQVAFGALKGLRQLHARGVVHKDVKPENVFIFGEDGKLADLGLSALVDRPASKSGTPGYLPPELSESGERPREDPSMDMYPYGTMLLEILEPTTLGRELKLMNGRRLWAKIDADTHRAFIAKIQDELSKRKREPWLLIAELIDYDPLKRPTSADTEARLAPFVTGHLPIL